MLFQSFHFQTNEPQIHAFVFPFTKFSFQGLPQNQSTKRVEFFRYLIFIRIIQNCDCNDSINKDLAITKLNSAKDSSKSTLTWPAESRLEYLLGQWVRHWDRDLLSSICDISDWVFRIMFCVCNDSIHHNLGVPKFVLTKDSSKSTSTWLR